jgi:hypothetical protein
VVDGIAAPEGQRALGREVLGHRRIVVEPVGGRRPHAPAPEPVREMVPAVGAELERTLDLLR